MRRAGLCAACVVLGVLTGTLANTAALQVPPAAPQVPASTAADMKLVQTVCGGCHARNSMLGSYRTPAEWEKVLAWMVDEGAVMSDDEFERVLRFVAITYGRVDVNAASLDDIQSVLELTEVQATRVVEARARRPLTTLEELADALGVTRTWLDPKQRRIAFAPD